MKEKKKIIFFGSDDFAAYHLERLWEAGHEIAAVVTQPDRPKGRGYQLTDSVVKTQALSNNITLLQPEVLHDDNFLDILINFQADLFVVIAYGQFLPEEILEIPHICSLNVHGSLLPKYRGAAPINWAVINGDKKTGVSIIEMNVKMDAGRIVAQVAMDIMDSDTSETLRQRMMKEGANLLLETVDHVDSLLKKASAQDALKVTFAPKLIKEMGEIKWATSAVQIHNLVRGLLPWPAAYTFYKGKMLKILKTQIVDAFPSAAKPGEIIDINKQGFVVMAYEKALLVQEVHMEASKRMDASSFIRGHKMQIGEVFSSKH